MSKTRDHSRRSLILMGVSGCGKSTVGKMLAERTGMPFFDGDDFHPKANVEKMARGEALDDDDREGWLRALRDLLARHEETPIILACSALKNAYREVLRDVKSPPHFVYLYGERDVLLERMLMRSRNEDHFMPATLLDSQLATLENPGDEVLRVEIDQSLAEIVEEILENF